MLSNSPPPKTTCLHLMPGPPLPLGPPGTAGVWKATPIPFLSLWMTLKPSLPHPPPAKTETERENVASHLQSPQMILSLLLWSVVQHTNRRLRRRQLHKAEPVVIGRRPVLTPPPVLSRRKSWCTGTRCITLSVRALQITLPHRSPPGNRDLLTMSLVGMDRRSHGILGHRRTSASLQTKTRTSWILTHNQVL